MAVRIETLLSARNIDTPPSEFEPLDKRYRKFEGGQHCLSCGDSIPTDQRECLSCTVIKMTREYEMHVISQKV